MPGNSAVTFGEKRAANSGATAFVPEFMAVGIDAGAHSGMNCASFQSLTRLRSGPSGPICPGTPPVKRGPWHPRRS